MKHFKHKKKFAFFAIGFAFAVVGIYNSVVLNADSSISSAKYDFVKRLDEVYGVVTPGRMVANDMEWKKIAPPVRVNLSQSAPIISQSVSTIASAGDNQEVPEFVPAEAAVKEELDLTLTEVTNQARWPQGLTNSQFSGNLTTNNGSIESLNVSLPNGDGISVSFSEMNGNVFEYELNGEVLSGMLYQVDQYSYMVNLTNGPMEGTRLRFAASNAAELQAQDAQNLAQNQDTQPQQLAEEQKFDQQAQQESLAPQQQETETIQDQIVQIDPQQNTEAQAM